MASATVTVDLSPLRKYRALLAADLRNSANGPVRQAFKQWAARYRAFLRERFDTYSKGGGDWQPLAESTIKRRRKGKGSRRFTAGTTAILKDTGTMFAALDPVFRGKPGQLQEDIEFGIRVGFGGRGQHNADAFAVADLAYWHHHGTNRVPARPIIVPPSELVKYDMREDMDRAIQKLQAATGNH